MNISELIAIVKNKLQKQIIIENIIVEDKTFLHKNHQGNEVGKFHLKILIQSKELKKISKVDSTKKIYKILDNEIKKFIHSIQILIR